MKNLLILLVILVIALSAIYSIFPQPTSTSSLKKFSSYSELQDFVKTNTASYSGAYYGVGTPMLTSTAVVKQASAIGGTAPSASGSESSTSRGSEDYSKTNIQVEGVDEPDIVKNDGKYIYTVSGRKVVIIDAYPAENANIVSEIEFNGTPQEIFVNKDRLVVFGWDESYTSSSGMPVVGIMPRYSYSQKTFVRIYDITDRTNPVLKRNISVDGNYYDSRMIGDYAYAIVNEPVYYSEPGPIPMPVIQSGGVSKTISASDIYYFDFPDTSYIFTNVLAINTQNDAEDLSAKTFLMGYSENMYVSTNNIYITYTKRMSDSDFYDRIIDEAIIPAVPASVQSKINEIRNSDADKYEKMQKIGEEFQNYLGTLGPEQAANVMKDVEERMKVVQAEIAKEIEKTLIHKISIDKGNIEYKTNGEVPGYTLNQFSMDEYNGNFRIATTTGNLWEGNSLNHLYVLDGDLKIIGKVEDLAQGEKIYSARFLGDRAYLVTFRKIDPLFVIDLSDASNPKVLGYLKVTGFSDYLHPYDENHIIGIGKETAGGNEQFAWYQGLKISLFDVSDVENPKEIGKIEIGDRGTDSEALYDHKAFLFDKEKNLLVIPVSLAKINETYYKTQSETIPDWAYGDVVWRGAYVFNVDLTNGIVLRGNVTHSNETVKESIYYYDYSSQISRSLYIDNVLYTLSSKMIKANSLDSLNEISKVQLPQEETYPYPYYMEGVGVAVPTK
jgi:uncharacterized secreted protein with C-terminal beta-propeller domain